MSRRAKLGFDVIALDDELQVTTHEDLVKNEEDRKFLSHLKEKARKLRCYHRNKHKYNKQKRAAARSISGKYKEAKRDALKRSQGWEFSQEEWERAWIDSGFVVIPGTITTQNPHGDVVPAFALRGSHRYNHTCMKRLDVTKPWSPENCAIVFRGEELGPENKWYRKDMPTV